MLILQNKSPGAPYVSDVVFFQVDTGNLEKIQFLINNDGGTWYRQTLYNKEKTTMGMFSSADQAKVTGKFESFKRGNFSAADTATVLNNTADILNKSSASSNLRMCSLY